MNNTSEKTFYVSDFFSSTRKKTHPNSFKFLLLICCSCQTFSMDQSLLKNLVQYSACKNESMFLELVEEIYPQKNLLMDAYTTINFCDEKEHLTFPDVINFTHINALYALKNTHLEKGWVMTFQPANIENLFQKKLSFDLMGEYIDALEWNAQDSSIDIKISLGIINLKTTHPSFLPQEFEKKCLAITNNITEIYLRMCLRRTPENNRFFFQSTTEDVMAPPQKVYINNAEEINNVLDYLYRMHKKDISKELGRIGYKTVSLGIDMNSFLYVGMQHIKKLSNDNSHGLCVNYTHLYNDPLLHFTHSLDNNLIEIQKELRKSLILGSHVAGEYQESLIAIVQADLEEIESLAPHSFDPGYLGIVGQHSFFNNTAPWHELIARFFRLKNFLEKKENYETFYKGVLMDYLASNDERCVDGKSLALLDLEIEHLYGQSNMNLDISQDVLPFFLSGFFITKTFMNHRMEQIIKISDHFSTNSEGATYNRLHLINMLHVLMGLGSHAQPQEFSLNFKVNALAVINAYILGIPIQKEDVYPYPEDLEPLQIESIENPAKIINILQKAFQRSLKESDEKMLNGLMLYDDAIASESCLFKEAICEGSNFTGTYFNASKEGDHYEMGEFIEDSKASYKNNMIYPHQALTKKAIELILVTYGWLNKS